MEKIDENQIVEIVYNKINSMWGKFPNIWKYTTKDEVASEAIISLYRQRKEDGVPHIIHYLNTKGSRSIAPLISTVVHNEMVYQARWNNCTGIYNSDKRRRIRKAVSVDSSINVKGEELSLSNIISDPSVNIESTVDYIILYESLPDKTFDNIYLKDEDGYKVVSYKTLINHLMMGYNIKSISELLFKKVEKGFIPFDDTYNMVRKMKEEVQDFLIKNGLVEGSVCK